MRGIFVSILLLIFVAIIVMTQTSSHQFVNAHRKIQLTRLSTSRRERRAKARKTFHMRDFDYSAPVANRKIQLERLRNSIRERRAIQSRRERRAIQSRREHRAIQLPGLCNSRRERRAKARKIFHLPDFASSGPEPIAVEVDQTYASLSGLRAVDAITPFSLKENDLYSDDGTHNKTCEFCFSRLWSEEKINCCAKGEQAITLLPQVPKNILETAFHVPHVLRNSRYYNGIFSLAALGSNRYDPNTGLWTSPKSGVSVVQMNGRPYLRLFDPLDNQANTTRAPYTNNSRMYISEGERAQNASENKSKTKFSASTSPAIIKVLDRFFNTCNSWASSFRTLLRDATGAIIDTTVAVVRFSAASVNSEAITATIFSNAGTLNTDDSSSITTINIGSGESSTVPLGSSAMEPLLFPLLFPFGTKGYGVSSLGDSVSTTDRTVGWLNHHHVRWAMYMRQRLLAEPSWRPFPRLVQEWAVIMLARHQDLRFMQYKRLLRNAASVGHGPVALPKSNPFNPASIRRHKEDLLHVCNETGGPHIMITMTANPNWPEVVASTHKGTSRADHMAIISRAFKIRKDELLRVLRSGRFFPKPLMLSYVIEWQGRGLPHIHIIMTFALPLRHVNLEQYVSCAIPDPKLQPRLHALVTKHMMHGPCGQSAQTADMNPNKHGCQRKNGCNDAYCRFGFPKPFSSVAVLVNPTKRCMYVRKAGHTFTNRDGFTFTEQWVVPYSPGLLEYMDCHINADYVTSPAASTYLVKYLCKASVFHRASIHAGDDQVEAVQLCRQIHASFAIWTALAFPQRFTKPSCRTLNMMTPHLKEGPAGATVQDEVDLSLDAPLPDITSVGKPPGQLEREKNKTRTKTFKKQLSALGSSRRIFPSDLERYFNRPDEPGVQELTFEEYFNKYNPLNEILRDIHCEKSRKRLLTGEWLFDEHRGVKYWVHLLGAGAKRFSRIIRIQNPSAEAFFARLLLQARPATSWTDLRTVPSSVGGQPITFSWRDAAVNLGLLADLNEYELCFEQATMVLTAPVLRQLAVTLSNAGAALDSLWSKFTDKLMGDDTAQVALQQIAAILERCGKTLESVKLGAVAKKHNVNFNVNQVVRRTINRFQTVNTALSSSAMSDDISHQPEQQAIYTDFFSSIRRFQDFKDKPDSTKLASYINWITVLGPGGCGKSFVAKAIISKLRTEGEVVLACASTGIAALAYEGGQTLHKSFLIKVPEDEEEVDRVRMEGRAKTNMNDTAAQWHLLKASTALIIDEISMVTIPTIIAIHHLICDAHNLDPTIPFGGFPVLMLGDPRQLPPVIRGGNAHDAYLQSIFSWDEFINHCDVRELRQSVRHETDLPFGQWVQSVGDNNMPYEEICTIHPRELPQHVHSNTTQMIKPDGLHLSRIFVPSSVKRVTTLDEAIGFTFTSVDIIQPTAETARCLIIASDNVTVDAANAAILDAIDEVLFTMTAADSEFEFIQGDSPIALQGLPPSAFADIALADAPPQKLYLKIGAVVVVTRNVNLGAGVANGSKAIVRDINIYRIDLEMLTGPMANTSKTFSLPRFTVHAKTSTNGIKFNRLQFPLRLGWASTVHKAQGLTLDRVAIILQPHVFSHGALYTALSRARTASSVCVLLPPDGKGPLNVIYQPFLDAATPHTTTTFETTLHDIDFDTCAAMVTAPALDMLDDVYHGDDANSTAMNTHYTCSDTYPAIASPKSPSKISPLPLHSAASTTSATTAADDEPEIVPSQPLPDDEVRLRFSGRTRLAIGERLRTLTSLEPAQWLSDQAVDVSILFLGRDLLAEGFEFNKNSLIPSPIPWSWSTRHLNADDTSTCLRSLRLKLPRLTNQRRWVMPLLCNAETGVSDDTSNHWVAVCADFDTLKIHVFDSFGRLDSDRQIAKHLITLLNSSSLGYLSWSFVPRTGKKLQTDGHSCGVYVAFFAFNFIRGGLISALQGADMLQPNVLRGYVHDQLTSFPSEHYSAIWDYPTVELLHHYVPH